MDKEIIFCTIDGKDAFCEAGATILAAAKELGIEIPSLCYHPELSAAGSCRICVVEIEGEKILHPACTTLVKSGMVIKTNSKRVLEARKLLIEMILSHHTADCMVCDASGDCLLERYTYEFGATGTLFKRENPVKVKTTVESNNPFIILDRNKCILCMKCIKACKEWTHRKALTFVDKGSRMVVSTLYDQGLEKNGECNFCGNCITVCPVGALSEKSAVRAGRFPEVKKVNSVCGYCGVGCGIVAYEKDNRIIKIRGNENSPVSRGRLCIKGKFAFDFISSPERLTKPLIKNEDGSFREADLLEALILIKQKIEEVKEKNGALAGLSSARCTNEENYIFQKFVRTVLGTDNIDHCARICHSPSVAGLRMTLGSGAMTNPIEDIKEVDCFFIIGSNMTSTHPVISWEIMTRIKQGAIMILVDPRKSELSPYATLHLQLNPGSDMALIYAMIKFILEERMEDEEMLSERCEGVEEFIEKVETLDIDELIKATGLDENDIRLAARLFAISGSSSIFYAMGITQHIFGTANVVALADLALLCGKVGKGHTGINPLRGQNNVQGACDMGALAGVLPGYQDLMDSETRAFFKEQWGVELPAEKGKTLTELFTDAANGELDFLYIMGENPVISDPDSKAVVKGLENVGFLVVQDLFLTETAQYADVILPAASFAEKDGTFTNTERRVQRVRKIVDSPSEEVLPDWMVINRLGELFGAEWNYHSWQDIFTEMRRVSKIYSHIVPDMLEKSEFFWPGDELGQSVKRLHHGRFSRGKGRLIFNPIPEAYKTDSSYPYLLIIGRLYEQYHTGTMTRKTAGINKLQPHPEIYVNPRDAIKLKVRDGDQVRINSDIGEIEAACRLSLEVKAGNLFMSFHYKEAIANLLTGKKVLDPHSKIAGIKVVPVNIKYVKR